MPFDKALNLSENLLTFLRFQAWEGEKTIEATACLSKAARGLIIECLLRAIEMLSIMIIPYPY